MKSKFYSKIRFSQFQSIDNSDSFTKLRPKDVLKHLEEIKNTARWDIISQDILLGNGRLIDR